MKRRLFAYALLPGSSPCPSKGEKLAHCCYKQGKAKDSNDRHLVRVHHVPNLKPTPGAVTKLLAGRRASPSLQELTV